MGIAKRHELGLLALCVYVFVERHRPPPKNPLYVAIFYVRETPKSLTARVVKKPIRGGLPFNRKPRKHQGYMCLTANPGLLRTVRL